MAEEKGRFDHLEIGVLPPAAPSPAKPPKAPADATGRVACCHCGQPNLAADETCWACLKPVRPSDAPARQIVLDGAREQTRPAGELPAPDLDVSVHQSDIVVRFQGKVYFSDDRDLPGFVRRVMDKVRAEGLTPEVLAELRRDLPRVTYRPATTPNPSDGDLDFWRETRARTRLGRTIGYFAGGQMLVPWHWLVMILGGAVLAAWLLFYRVVFQAIDKIAAP